MVRLTGVALTACLLVPACTGASGGGGQGSGVNLTQAQYGNDWPLTVDSAVVRCRNSAAEGVGSVTVEINGTEYAVNGTAMDSEKWPDFNKSSYWRDDTSLGQGVKISIGPIIDKGLS